MIKTKVVHFLQQQLHSTAFTLLTPKDSSLGDFAIHKSAVKNEKINLQNLAEDCFDTVEEKGNFVNFFVSRKLLLEALDTILHQQENYGTLTIFKNKKIMVEFAHPNTHKLFHIGHLRNIILGESLSRMMTAAGADIIRANYQGDVGLHIAKCLWAVQRRKSIGESPKEKGKMQFLGKAYADGNKAYTNDETAKKEIDEMNRQIFNKDPAIIKLWNETRQWSLDYFSAIYERLNVAFDRLYFESEVADKGLSLAQTAQKKGVLTKSDGAVIFDGKKYGVDTRVFINSKGLPTYEAKELGLAADEFSEFGTLDRCIHVVGSEQASFFKTLFCVEALMDEQLYKDKQYHLIYGMVRLKEGKMSSREDMVIEGPWLLDEIKKKLQKAFSCTGEIAEVLTIAAVKYAFLKVDPKKDIVFDIDQSINLHGNSGPYLLYTYARMRSVITKAKGERGKAERDEKIPLAPEEQQLLRLFFRFPEVVESAAVNKSPHLICAYAFDLAQTFNLLYEKLPIIKAEEKQRALRLNLTQGSAQLLKNSFTLLGIEAVERI